MPQRYKRYFLKDKESREILSKAFEKLKVDASNSMSKVRLEIVETEDAEVLLLNGRPILVKTASHIFPTLIYMDFFRAAPKVVVDMGAVPYVCKGANVMAPGIRRFEGEFQKGDIVFVVDERHFKPIAVGEVAYDIEEARKVNRGIIVNILHFVGDKIWKSMKQLSVSSGD